LVVVTLVSLLLESRRAASSCSRAYSSNISTVLL